ncbi:esterase-like activity of phytase family protein [Qipengyuania sp. MTN3-11]|uniref:esterase-like activity of phytase family protein n=1 Tax=Qipengyuania sp. MTN3-11 TaxID=3056557 RepID=UPI0036F41A4B
MTARRLIALGIALVLAPGLWWRTPVPPPDHMPPVDIRPIAIERQAFGPFGLQRGWELTPRDPYAGGYSALLWRGGDTLLAASDNGRLAELVGPDFDEAEQHAIFGTDSYDKIGRDIEALAGTPQGKVWAGVEARNAILRISPALAIEDRVRPPAMARWRSNSGPETLARLPDDRFVVIAERGREGEHEGIVFAGDPISNDTGEQFRLEVPAGFRPVDGVASTDGTLLVLLRRLIWNVPADFRTAIALYRIADLEPRAVWRPTAHYALPEGAPFENYEGIALRPEANGGATVWLISDDNLSGFQRSLLLELTYRPS